MTQVSGLCCETPLGFCPQELYQSYDALSHAACVALMSNRGARSDEEWNLQNSNAMLDVFRIPEFFKEGCRGVRKFNLDMGHTFA
jgi:hypothetical protein